MAVLKRTTEEAVARRKAEESKIASAITSSPVEVNAPEKNYDLMEIEEIGANHKNISTHSSGTGCITVINHERCGKRIHVEGEIWRKLGCPRLVKLFIADHDLLIQDGGETGTAVKFDRKMDFDTAVETHKGKVVLYTAEVAERLSKEWNLDTDNGCSFTGGNFTMCTVRGKLTAVVTYDYKSKVTEDDDSDIVDATTYDDTVEEANMAD